MQWYLVRIHRHFNPLPPHGGRRNPSEKTKTPLIFQSTPSAWRETSASQLVPTRVSRFQSTPSAWRETREKRLCHHSPQPFQSTPSAWRETANSAVMLVSFDFISIHSLRMEGDSATAIPCDDARIFQSTPSAWRETRTEWSLKKCVVISIHSLRMEGDVRENGYF